MTAFGKPLALVEAFQTSCDLIAQLPARLRVGQDKAKVAFEQRAVRELDAVDAIKALFDGLHDSLPVASLSLTPRTGLSTPDR